VNCGHDPSVRDAETSPSTRLQQSYRRKPIVKPARRDNCMWCAGSFARACLPGPLDDENMHVIPGTGAPWPRTCASARPAVAARMHGGRLAEVDSQTLQGAETGLRVCACAPPAMPRHARPSSDERGRCPAPPPGRQRPRFPTPALSRLQLCLLLGSHGQHTHLSLSCLDDSLPRSYFNV